MTINDFLKKLNIWFAILYMVVFTTPFFRYIFGENFRIMGVGFLLLWGITALCTGKFRYISKFLGLVLAHLIVFVYMSISDMGNVSTIIVGYIAFWSFSVIFEFYYQQENLKAIRYITIVLLIVITITAITTIIASLTYPNISKNTYIDDPTGNNLMHQLNAGGFDYIGGMSVLAPILMYLSIRGKRYILLIPFGLCVTTVLMSGYAIAFLVLFVGLIMCLVANPDGSISVRNLIPVLIVAGIFLLVMKHSDIVINLFLESNSHLAGRLTEIQDALNGKISKNSDLFARIDFYKMSYDVFWDNILIGVGPYYYGEGGLGNHSQILDDLGRYGLLAIVVYASMVYTFKQWIDNIKAKSGKEFSLIIPYLVFVLFSCLNPTLILPILGMTLFFVLPGLYYI